MRENINEFDGYWETRYYLEYVPSIIVDGVKQAAYFIDTPIEFRCKVKDHKKATKRQRQIINRIVSTDVLELIETRADLPFKKEDLILSDLEVFPEGKVGRKGIKFKNFSRVRDLDIDQDGDSEMNDLRFFNNNNKTITTLFTT